MSLSLSRARETSAVTVLLLEARCGHPRGLKAPGEGSHGGASWYWEIYFQKLLGPHSRHQRKSRPVCVSGRSKGTTWTHPRAPVFFLPHLRSGETSYPEPTLLGGNQGLETWGPGNIQLYLPLGQGRCPPPAALAVLLHLSGGDKTRKNRSNREVHSPERGSVKDCVTHSTARKLATPFNMGQTQQSPHQRYRAGRAAWVLPIVCPQGDAS